MSQQVLREPFNIETHKKTFINYLEVVIMEDGTIVYATPSHQEKLIALATQKLKVSREQLNDLCPIKYYFDFMNWLCQISGCVSLWNTHMVGKANEQQRKAIEQLIKEGLYHGQLAD